MLVNSNLAAPQAELVNAPDYLNDAFIEKLWYEFDEQVTREQIRHVAAEVAGQFKDATVTTFIPIFIYRETYEKLRSGV